MKVVIISQYDSGGAGIAALRLHKALLAEGVDCHMLVFNKSCNVQNVEQVQRPQSSKLIEHLPLPIYNNKYKKTASLIDIDFECISFPESIDYLTDHPLIQEADVINLHWVGNRLSYKTFFKKVQKPIVWTLHDMNPMLGCAHFYRDLSNNPQWREFDDSIRKKKEKWIHQNPNISIVNLCEWMKSFSEKSEVLGCYPQYIIHNSIDTSIFRMYPQRPIREILGISENEKVLMFVSQYVGNTRKGFDILLDSISDMANCTLLVIGVPPKNLKTKCNVIVMGSITDEHYMALLYASADAFVLPSREDNLPNTMLESLCCGTPVITMKNGGMTDIIENGRNGYIASEINAESFRQAIEAFLANGVTLKRELIASKAHSMFSPSAQANGYIAIYKQALNNDK